MVSYLCGNKATLHWLWRIPDNTGGRSCYWCCCLTPWLEKRGNFFYFSWVITTKKNKTFFLFQTWVQLSDCFLSLWMYLLLLFISLSCGITSVLFSFSCFSPPYPHFPLSFWSVWSDQVSIFWIYFLENWALPFDAFYKNLIIHYFMTLTYIYLIYIRITWLLLRFNSWKKKKHLTAQCCQSNTNVLNGSQEGFMMQGKHEICDYMIEY